MKSTPPANPENLAAEYWTDAFAACTSHLLDAAQQNAAFIPCASRWLAAGLVAYDRDYHVLARWVEAIAELTRSEMNSDGWRALKAEPAEGERLASLLAEVGGDRVRHGRIVASHLRTVGDLRSSAPNKLPASVE